MAWTASAIFRAWLSDSLRPTPGFAGQWDGDVLTPDLFKAALFDNTVTPLNAKNAVAAQTAYGVGEWASGGVSHAMWPAVGRDVEDTGAGGGFSLATPDSIVFGGNPTSGGGVLDLANVYGDLLYDDSLTAPVADQGAAYHYFGGAQSVTGGTFTIIWDPAGIMLVTV